MKVYVIVNKDSKVVGVFQSISEIIQEVGHFDNGIPSLKIGDTLLTHINGELHKIIYLLTNKVY